MNEQFFILLGMIAYFALWVIVPTVLGLIILHLMKKNREFEDKYRTYKIRSKKQG